MAVTKALDPQGVSAERSRLLAQQASLASGISGWTSFGDPNGLRDQQAKLAEITYRLNAVSTQTTGFYNGSTIGLLTPAYLAFHSGFDSAFSSCGFGLEQVSTS